MEESILIEKVKRGDHRAFKQLYDRNVTPLYRFMRQYSDDTFQVEDWVQRAFIKAYRSIATFHGTSRFATWLFTIALNEMKTDTRRANLVVFNSEEIANHFGRNDDQSFIWHDTMRTWLGELDQSKRTVFVLYEVEGYSHAEIASMLNVEEGTSRALLSRAKQFLRSKWQSEEKSI